ncbi:MAG: MFS transporter, partial [Geminicoccaceae bacterium]
GASIAAVATLGYGGFLIGPPVIGLLADHISLPAALGLVVILLGLVPGFALIALRTAKRQAHQTLSPSASARP